MSEDNWLSAIPALLVSEIFLVTMYNIQGNTASLKKPIVT